MTPSVAAFCRMASEVVPGSATTPQMRSWPPGERTRLVEHDGIGSSEMFQERGSLDENAVARCHRDGSDGGGWRREHQRAATSTGRRPLADPVANQKPAAISSTSTK